ncbi:sugar phosphate isomerase/epimerase family protein [Acetomicrobium sp. S15 = DSM 107314]|uniref:sugar phosphate isomerase/epimerase family protein n=1 Tax=Acetomicrobium sp. S15 = DSM 107314 TaxID=2529858 RepID=UPI0018E0D418|nr:sugar phosphate isomerase/epimerase [Acetomicrobium sp. S15 = DSM 107314]
MRNEDNVFIKSIGINVDAAYVDGDLRRLIELLDEYAEMEVECVEVPLHATGAMLGGKLISERVDEVSRILKRYHFHYSVHAPNPINLMDADEPELHKEALLESIRFSATINSKILVYHSGRYIPEEHFHIPWQAAGRATPETERRRSMNRREKEALLSLAKEGERLGVTLCLENARPYLDGGFYCYAEDPFRLAERVRDLNHPRIGITLDIGHAYLSAKRYGFDFLEAVRSVAPFTKHVHLHDNFGRVCSSLEKKQVELSALGRGDMHLPIGKGEIPVEEVFSVLCDCNYSGLLINEIRHRYLAWASDALDLCKRLLNITKESALPS